MRMSMQTVRQLALSVTMMIGLCLGDVLSPWAATAATYYVATNGSNSNPGTQSAPFQTIAKGVSVLTAGDTLYIRQGTYVESISANTQKLPSGTSWANAITIAGYPRETVTLRPTEGVVLILNAYNNPHYTPSLRYLIFDNLVLDAAGNGGGVSIYGDAAYIRIQNSEIKNATQQGIHGGTGANNIEFINLKVHHNGSNTGDHGFYICMPNTLIDGGEMYSNAGAGIQIYDKGNAGCANNNVVRNTRIYNNVTSGATLNYGDNIQFYNNISYNNGGGGVDVAYGNPTNTKIYNNTLYNNPSGGVQLIGPGVTGTVIKNNILYGNPAPISDWGATGTIQSHNFTSDPQFVNASGGDFHLQPSSPALHASDTGGEVGAYAGAPRGTMSIPNNLRVISVAP